MKKHFLLLTLLFFTCISFAQTRNLRLVKPPAENLPTNEKRKAIVIGMSDYGGDGLNLPLTINDANDMSNVLRQLGFEVTLLTDNDLKSLENNLKNWYSTIQGNDMAIFYYAGHGVQVKGQNYLLPIDFPHDACEDDVKYEALNAKQVVDNLDARQVGLKILILDACRTNPLKGNSCGRGLEDKGLAIMSVPTGTYFIYSTAPGTEANESKDLKNGIFTYYFKQEILKPGASIDDVVNATTLDVSNHTNGKQVPYKGGTLTGNYYFIPSVNPQGNNNNPAPSPAVVADNPSDLLRKANVFFGNKQYQEAFPLFQQAANAGNAGAQNRLGACYANGYGVALNHNQAVYWYRKAAEQNSDAAQYNLGYCYEKGLGIAKDNNQALVWYKKAAEQGYTAAKDAIERLQNNSAPVVQRVVEHQLPAEPEKNRFANYTETSANLNLEMVAVKGGTFTMGCTSEQSSDCDSDEKPAHKVTVSDFYIGKYEVTQAQWRAIMGNNPSKFKGDNLPVEQVSWNDVQEFIARLNTRSAKKYRLPTEAEWEFAARGGNSSRAYKFSGSNTVGAVSWYSDNSGSTTHIIGSAQSANELGICDMSGNVWEWCSDWFSDYSMQINSQRPSSGSNRVIRGGSWYYMARYMRVSFRNSTAPGNRSNDLGFRLACSSE